MLVLALLSLLIQAQPVKLAAPSAGGQFGFAVALEGDVAVVGAPGEDAGAVYVFRRNGPAWIQEARLVADTPAPDDQFGASVAVSGARIAVGAPGNDDRGQDAGAAYVFVDDPVVGWTQEARLTAGDGALGDAFGFSVALSGIRLVVGAPGDDGGGFETGAAYAFSLDPPRGWVEQSKLTAAQAHDDDAFGTQVALDGDLALVGTPAADEPRGDDAGLAFLFARAGTAWVRDGTLAAGDAVPGNGLGASVALDAGFVTRALVGAPDAAVGGPGGGAVYLFENPDTLWVQRVRLTPARPAEGNRFGHAVALDEDYAAVGAPGADDAGFDAGVVYVFAREAPSDLWTERTLITASDPGVGAWFGHAVAFSGGRLLVGAPRAGGAGDGAAYVFDEALLTAVEPAPVRRAGIEPEVSPNPARAGVTIAFTLAGPADVRLAVYDVMGREVARLVDGNLAQGRHARRWRPGGAAGVYVARLAVEGAVRVRTFVVVR